MTRYRTTYRTYYQDLWLDYQINRLPHLLVDIPQGYRYGQHLFNTLPPELSAQLRGTLMDTFNWPDTRFDSDLPAWVEKMDSLVMRLDRERNGN